MANEPPHYWAFEAEDGDGVGEPLHGLTFALDHQQHRVHLGEDMGPSGPGSESGSEDSDPPPPPSQYLDAGAAVQARSRDADFTPHADINVPGERYPDIAGTGGLGPPQGGDPGWLGLGSMLNFGADAQARERAVSPEAGAINASYNVMMGIFGATEQHPQQHGDLASAAGWQIEERPGSPSAPQTQERQATSNAMPPSSDNGAGWVAKDKVPGSTDATSPVPIGRPISNAAGPMISEVPADLAGSGDIFADASSSVAGVGHDNPFSADYSTVLRGDGAEFKDSTGQRLQVDADASAYPDSREPHMRVEPHSAEDTGELLPETTGSAVADSSVGCGATEGLEDENYEDRRVGLDEPIDADEEDLAPEGAGISSMLVEHPAEQRKFPLSMWDKIKECCMPEQVHTGSELEDDHGANGCLEAKFYRMAARYSRKGPGRCPCCCACIWFFFTVVTAGLGMVVQQIEVETSFDSFMKTDVPLSAKRDAFLAALGARTEEEAGSRRLHEQVMPGLTIRPSLELAPQRQELDGNSSRQLQDTMVLYIVYNVLIAYEVKDTARHKSIFHWENLIKVQEMETRLRHDSKWIELCNQAEQPDKALCDPGMSFVNYAMPTTQLANRSIVPTVVGFDGRGMDRLPLESAFRWIDQHQFGDIIFPKGFTKEDIPNLGILRSAFKFRWPCCSPTDPLSKQSAVLSERKTQWNDFVKNSLLPILQTPEPPADDYEDEDDIEEWPLNVFFSGNGFGAVEVMQALFADMKWAAFSFGFVFIYLVLHTRSVVLSVVGLLTIALSVPFSYVIFSVLSGTTKMSIASFLSLFLVVGLGSDVIFVYTDFWRDSSSVTVREVDRLVWTYQKAGKASLATTFTTSLSFFANLVSVLKPLREFGTFMGLCVVFVWLIVSGVFPPMLLIDDRYFTSCRIRFMSKAPKSSLQLADGELVPLSRRARYIGNFADTLYPRRRPCVALAIFAAIGFLIGTAANAKSDSGIPSIFPKDHNQNRGKEVLEEFPPVSEVFEELFPSPTTAEIVCQDWRFGSNVIADHQCPLFWCEADRVARLQEPDECQCFRKYSTSACKNRSILIAKHRIVGAGDITVESLEGAVGDRFVKRDETRLQASEDGSGGVEVLQEDVKFIDGQERDFAISHFDLKPVLVQEWESGTATVQPMTQLQATLERLSPGPCDWEEICYCGTKPCLLPGPWIPAGSLLLTSRRLQESWQTAKDAPQFTPTVAANNRASLNIIFGLIPDPDTPLLGEKDMSLSWSFDDAFKVQNPWTQRKMYKFCRHVPQDLRVTEKRCWIQNFRDHLISQSPQERFPTLEFEFDSQLQSFLNTGATVGKHPPTPARDQLWLREGQLKATFFVFEIDLARNAGTKVALDAMARWEKHMEDFNTEAAELADVGTVWQTSSLWGRAQAQDALVSSVALTLGIVLLLAFLGMLVFTRDLTLSIFVVIATIGVVCGLAFFITTVMGWAIGPIEVIALIVFIGYAVTYALHIAHKYGSAEAIKEPEPHFPLDGKYLIRYKRTKFALKSIGGAALGSAVTTAGCSVFLLFCEMVIFQKLGGVVLAVTLMSIFTALMPLPSALFMIGPLEPGLRCGPSTTALSGVGGSLASAGNRAVENARKAASNTRATPPDPQ